MVLDKLLFVLFAGIIWGDYELEWKRQRSVSLRILKDLGFGRRGIESKICEEAQHLIKAIEVRKSLPYSQKALFFSTVYKHCQSNFCKPMSLPLRQLKVANLWVFNVISTSSVFSACQKKGISFDVPFSEHPRSPVRPAPRPKQRRGEHHLFAAVRRPVRLLRQRVRPPSASARHLFRNEPQNSNCEFN